ncbi:hypothetical protein CC117_10945 [Parafrankia colletiae]|uniref:Uncharacterized protein n=1 Tax=Parafrankia colletiae TaxID=573497 RepID=A0A1S1RAX7_9ACTN|nr:hypothetical protein CC117_10945 [Parafrankia colletiae]
MDQLFEVAMDAISHIFEGVQQYDEGCGFLDGNLTQVPRQQVRIIAERLQVWFGFEKIGQPSAVRQGAKLAPMFSQPPDD